MNYRMNFHFRGLALLVLVAKAGIAGTKQLSAVYLEDLWRIVQIAVSRYKMARSSALLAGQHRWEHN
jgi:hypothetical protein